MDTTDWNEAIRQAARKSKLSVYALAKRSGVHVAPIQRFMAGTSGLTLKTAQKVCGVLNLTLKPSRKGGA